MKDGPAEHPALASQMIGVAFADVKFRYPGVTSAVDARLKQVTFEVKAGTSLGIVGPTGAGKSTIARLLLRFFDVEGGSVRWAVSMSGPWRKRLSEDSWASCPRTRSCSIHL